MNRDAIKKWAAKHEIANAALEELFDLETSYTIHSTQMAPPDETMVTPISSPRAPNLYEADRYEFICPLGKGGMGEVHRVFDRRLQRTVAMKVIHKGLHFRKEFVARFFEEAQISSQLQHTNIIPIHDIGSLPDGRIYFTMQEIRGQSFRAILSQRKRAEKNQQEHPWPIRRLIEIFLKACSAMAYAHSHGVIHRDLKPSNIMVDYYDEVQVVDWGIAKPLEQLQSTEEPSQLPGVSGTPAYMSPEQASGLDELLGIHSDIYTLGAILYTIISGRPPFEGSSSEAILQQVRTEEPEALSKVVNNASRNGYMPLLEICNRAMKKNPLHRYACADDMCDELLDWLNGTQAREKALILIDKASKLRAEIEALELELFNTQSSIRPNHEEDITISLKNRIFQWEQEDKLHSLRHQISQNQFEVEQHLSSALSHQPDLVEAHSALAEFYREQHQIAEINGDIANAESLLKKVKTHSEWLLEAEKESFANYLEGSGSFSIDTTPTNAKVYIAKVALIDRRLVPQKMEFFGFTPIHNATLPMGNYVLEIQKDNRERVRYPLRIHREYQPKRTKKKTPNIWLPKPGEIKSKECYVPCGEFVYGGDLQAHDAGKRQRMFLPGFIIQKHPITHQDWLEYLHDLIDTGEREQAFLDAPRERASKPDALGALLYKFENNRFSLQVDSDGDQWNLEWPVMMISYETVCRYVTWRQQKDGFRWSLPTEAQWEKAARGVDERVYPWGNHCDPSWCRIRDNSNERASPASIHDNPLDQSPYGVQGLAGNCHDLTNNLTENGTRVTARGGSWWSSSRTARVCGRHRFNTTDKVGNLSFRMVRALPE